MSIIENAKRAVKKAVGKATGAIPVYDMSTKEAREKRVRIDFEYAKQERGEQTEKMQLLDDYYSNKMYSKAVAEELAQKYGWRTKIPSIPDPFIQVESQIDDVLPEVQFTGRADDVGSVRAKKRQQVVEHVLYEQKVSLINLDNERNLKKLGNAFWKVAFDSTIKPAPWVAGDIVVGNPDPANIYPQPGGYEVESSEWIIYAYRDFRARLKRIHGDIIDEIFSDSNHSETEIYDRKQSVDDNTLQVVEYWYRDEDGDICCSICVNGTEVRHIEKYWFSTKDSGNKMFPIIKYCNVPVSKSFWDLGEIERIMDMCDAENRELITALMNDMMMGNDIVLKDEGAIVGASPNIPGAQWTVKAGKNVRRLGGVANASNALNLVNFLQDKIQDTNGNYYTNQGTEPTRVTTASGIAQLNERADRRASSKKAGRLEGFIQLAQLIDWTALEFYNTERNLMTRPKQRGENPKPFTFTNTDVQVQRTIGGETYTYYPMVDVEINAGQGLAKSKAFTLQATQELAQMPIQASNAAIVKSIIDQLDLPNSQELKDSIDQVVGQATGQQTTMSPQEEQFIHSLAQSRPDVIKQIGQLPSNEQVSVIEKLMQLPTGDWETYLSDALGGVQQNGQEQQMDTGGNQTAGSINGQG